MACPAAAPVGRGRRTRRWSPSMPRSRHGRWREQSTAGILEIDASANPSSLSRDAGVIVNTPEHDAGAAPFRRFRGTQMFGKNIPHRHALLLADRGPSRHFVALAGLDGAAVAELDIGNPASDRFRGSTGIGHAANPNHIAALLIIRVGIEEIVADVLEG